MNDFPKTTEYKAATALACEIAMTHPDRFNEAVAAGHYPCAPRTTPGRRRQFDVDDLIALRLYQRFLDAGMGAAKAGHKACKVREFLSEYPGAEQLYIVSPSIGSAYYLPDFDVTQQHAPSQGPHSPAVDAVEVYNFHYLRGQIVHAITEEAKTVGRD